MRCVLLLAWRPLALACVLIAAPAPARAAGAGHDPNRTATILVHGFELTGADRHGVFGEDMPAALAESVATLASLPVARGPAGPLPINVVAGTTYYGDAAPSYYTAANRAELDRITAEWGGGVPRYAFIVARHARQVLERSGASQVNIVSASFGSLITRWLIEKDVGGLAGEGRIARWLTVEGLVAGNWVASHDDLVDLLSVVAPEPIDVLHMSYGWIEAHLHAPRGIAESPLYAGILVGQVGSTDDSGNQAALRTAMLVYDEYMPNDGVQALPDAGFAGVAAGSRFAGRTPTQAVFHTDHLGIRSVRAAWAEAATFITASRRVTVTMTRARVANLREPQYPFWNWTPAEVLFESRVFSPAAAARWAITEPLSARVKEGAAAPLRRYRTSGETQELQHVLFDDLVLGEETELRLELRATEVDYDPRYGVFEAYQAPYHDDLGGGTISVSTLGPGSYAFGVPDWSCEITVETFDYPFAPLVSVPGPGPVGTGHGRLVLSPNPARSQVRIGLPPSADDAADETATLEVLDVSGRAVRRMAGLRRDGFVWDGHDRDGRAVRAGVYLVRVVAPGETWLARACLLR
ncbi:MAG: FlgD immunoglobulin-like domain containing protein [Candidatus Eiseniibacteriota bacterium]